MKSSLNYRLVSGIVSLFVFTFVLSLGLSSCFKKNGSGTQSSMSTINFQAPTVEGISWSKMKFSAKATSTDSNKEKQCAEAVIPEAGEWRNFSGVIPSIEVKLTSDCEYDFVLGFGGTRDGKNVVFEGKATQVVKKSDDGTAEVTIDIRENSESDPIKVEGKETDSKQESVGESSSNQDTKKVIKVKKLKLKKSSSSKN